MMKWLRRIREDREIEKAIHFGPPYASDLHALSELLRSDCASKRITPGHS